MVVQGFESLAGAHATVVAVVNHMCMKLYKIRIGNKLDQTVRTELVLSEAPISIGQHMPESLIGINADPDDVWAEFVLSVEQAHIRINPFTEEEHQEMMQVLWSVSQ